MCGNGRIQRDSSNWLSTVNEIYNEKRYVKNSRNGFGRLSIIKFFVGANVDASIVPMEVQVESTQVTKC